MSMDAIAKASLFLALGALSGFLMAQDVKDEAYLRGARAGYEQALEKCNGPSRLERAAKWVAR